MADGRCLTAATCIDGPWCRINAECKRAAVPQPKQGDLSESQLATLCAALGWQGGTYWQAVDEIRRLVAIARAAEKVFEELRAFTDREMTVGDRYSNMGQTMLNAEFLLREAMEGGK